MKAMIYYINKKKEIKRFIMDKAEAVAVKKGDTTYWIHKRVDEK